MQDYDSGTTIIERWFHSSADIHNLRTAIIPKSGLVAVHYVTMLTHKIMLMISLPKTSRIQEILEEHYEVYKKRAEELKNRAREEQDPLLEKEANEILKKIELARAYNTFVDLLAPIDLIRNHLENLISSSTSINGKGIYALLRLQGPDGGKRFGLFRPKDENANNLQ